MRVKSLILLAVAVLVAGGTAILVRGWLASERARYAATAPRQPEVRTGSQILIAKNDLVVGQFVRPEDLRWQPWPDDAIAPTYVVQGKRPLEDYVGAVVRSRTAAGEPIIEGRLISPKNSGFLAAVLPPGMRAISVPVSVTSGISGFLFPGDKVDVLLTITVREDTGSGSGGGSNDRKVTETVLTDVRVLAIDQKLDSKPGETQVARTVTLEVTPKQSEMMVLTNEMGRLSLSLRSLATGEGDDTATLTGADAADPRPGRGGVTLDSDVSRVLTPLAIAGTQRHVAVVRGEKVEDHMLKWRAR